jgi:hypothetical protein
MFRAIVRRLWHRAFHKSNHPIQERFSQFDVIEHYPSDNTVVLPVTAERSPPAS